MKFWKALAYFFGEAAVSLVRSWKVSLVAVLTIAVSLFVGGLFLLVSSNLSQAILRWRSEARIILYLSPEIPEEEVVQLQQGVAARPWVQEVVPVSGEMAQRRFRELFPSLADLMEGWEEDPLPPSLEIALNPREVERRDLGAWIRSLREERWVTMVDDDRDWLRQLEVGVALLRGVGLGLGGVLLGAAIFTIASVIRLAAYLYQEEIAIMRLVGATEFYIRGPFYIEGFLQGLLGGVVGVLSLYGAYVLVRLQAPTSAWGSLLMADFLSPQALLFLILLGGGAGLTGALVSLRRETFGEEKP